MEPERDCSINWAAPVPVSRAARLAICRSGNRQMTERCSVIDGRSVLDVPLFTECSETDRASFALNGNAADAEVLNEKSSSNEIGDIIRD